MGRVAVFSFPPFAEEFFGLLGGYLTDRLGRRRVLVWSILLYGFSACAAGFVTSPVWLLVFRCTTFVGVCVEFCGGGGLAGGTISQPQAARGGSGVYTSLRFDWRIDGYRGVLYRGDLRGFVCPPFTVFTRPGATR